ncbi:MAG: amino acid permease [Candidatus Margulisbacteria bacterium]|nr:amino acid permease [Candidatus Margulisiibacteriota bacterium]
MNSPKLSTFTGVFTPNILTIIGVIIFLRSGFVVGNAGLLSALLILVLCHVVSVITTFSLASIATNMSEVKGGGIYYLISRSIGVGHGGAIGIILYLAQTISVSMYIIGFCEVIVSLFPGLVEFQKLLGLITLGVLFIPAYKGADIASKVQVYILAALGLSLLVFFVSSIIQFDQGIFLSNLQPAYLPGISFGLMFALFFPAVTGFTQGVSLSGVLKTPQKSIMIGTFLAVFAGFIVYFIAIILLAGTASREQLLTDYYVMQTISFIPAMIILGVFASTISSGLGSFMGAPHILQAFSKDKILPFIEFFAVGSKKTGEPKRAVIMTFIIAAIAIIVADLNSIAPVITMFFLISYGMMNYSTFIESYSKNPSFRPSFKYNHWIVSLIGVVVIVVVMLIIDVVSAVVAFLILFGLNNYLSRSKTKKQFKDSRTGYYFQKIKEYMIKLQSQPIEMKNWRPQILLLTGKPKDRIDLIKFGKTIEASKGTISLLWVLRNYEGNPLRAKFKAEKELLDYTKNEEIKTLGDVVVADNYLEGLKVIVQTYGFQGFRPNTLLLGWSDKEGKEREDYLEIIRFANMYGKNIAIFDGSMDFLLDSSKTSVVDVWWRGEANGALMLMLAHLLVHGNKIKNAKLRLMRSVDDKLKINQAEEELEDLLVSSRIDAEVCVVLDTEEVCCSISTYSKDADVVFLGLSFGEDGSDFLKQYNPYRESFKSIVLVKSSDKLKLEE